MFFQANKTTVVIGQSGCGKSTLLDLILRIYPAPSGAILFGGISAEHFELSAYRRQFSVVSQHPFLINGTVLDNISYGCSEVPDVETVWEVLKAVQLFETINKFEFGLEQPVGENGNKLSGGQKQRLALARALMAERQVLVLDEATSALDKETEERVWQGLFAMRKGKTTIIVTHRRSCLEYADQIYQLEPACEYGDRPALKLVNTAE